MKMLLMKTIIIWAIVPIAWASSCVLPSDEVVPIELGIHAKEDQYRAAIASLHNSVKGDQKYYGIPMVAPKSSVPRFVYVELKLAADESITLGINKDNLYVEGYCDKYEGNYRARFFTSASVPAKQHLFPQAVGSNRKDMNYAGDYPSIMTVAKTSKSKAGLGIQNLRSLVEKVYGNPINDQAQAQFLLVAIQMVLEAARFKYVEDQVVDYFEYEIFTPDCKMLKFLNRWGAISKAIKDSKKGAIDIELTNEDGEVWKVENVTDIAPCMGILNYVK